MENKKGKQQQQLGNKIEKMSGTAGINWYASRGMFVFILEFIYQFILEITYAYHPYIYPYIYIYIGSSSKDTEDKNKGRMSEWKASTCINGQFNVGESCKFNEHLGGSTSIPVPKQLVNEDTMKKCMGQFHELGAVPSIHPLFNLSFNNKVEEDAIFKGSNYHQMNPLLGAPSASIPFFDLSKVEDIFIKPPMNQLLGPLSSILPQPHIDPSFALQFKYVPTALYHVHTHTHTHTYR